MTERSYATEDELTAHAATPHGGGGGGAPTTSTYLVTTADAGLSAEVVVGTTPGGELGGTWASPTVDSSHAGGTHAATQAAAEATAASALTTHAAAADPHTGYRLESADHSHASTGLQAGQVAHSALSGIGATDHHAAPAAGPDANVTVDAAGAAGTASTFARSGHGHQLATSSATPAATASAGAAGTSGVAPSRGDHAHAHGTFASGDLHTEYVTETAHGGVSPTGHHDEAHTMASHSDNTFDGDIIPNADGTLIIGSEAASWSDIFLGKDSNTAGTRPALIFDRARSASAKVEPVDQLGAFTYRGWDGAAFQNAARVIGIVDAATSAGNVPTAILFQTTTAGTPTGRWRIESAGHLRPETDATYDIGLTGTRPRAVYADTLDADTALTLATGSASWAATPSTQAFGDAAAAGTAVTFPRGDHKHAMPADPHSGYAKSIQPTTNTAINSVTDVNLVSQAVAGLAVGDNLLVDAWFVLFNNSGAAATYVFTLDIGAAFDIEFTTLAIAAAAGQGWAVHLNGAMGIVSTSLSRTITKMDMAVASGASGGDATLAATQLEAMRWAESATNLTGSQTVTLKVRSSTATATQQGHLVAASIQKASL